jgi:hypothetical protein
MGHIILCDTLSYPNYRVFIKCWLMYTNLWRYYYFSLFVLHLRLGREKLFVLVSYNHQGFLHKREHFSVKLTYVNKQWFIDFHPYYALCRHFIVIIATLKTYPIWEEVVRYVCVYVCVIPFRVAYIIIRYSVLGVISYLRFDY